MNNELYLEMVKKCQEKGLEIHPGIERKCVNGVYGMYATQDIAAGTVFGSFPKSSRIQISSAYRYPNDWNDRLKLAFTMAKEYEKGTDSEYYFIGLCALDTIDELKDAHVYFFNESELKAIEQMSPLLHQLVVHKKTQIQAQLDQFTQFDSTLDKDAAFVALNAVNSRCWDDSGLLPWIDLFNHSEENGYIRAGNETHFYIKSKLNYKPGDQLWISYDRKDMYELAINYNFFDPNGTHFICFGYRGLPIVASDFERAIIKKAAQKFDMFTQETGRGLLYKLREPHACFLENAPSARLIEFIQSTCYRSQQELQNDRCHPQSFDARLNQILDSFIDINKVDSIELNELPPKVHRFYHLLKKEKAMLLSNKKWALFNSPVEDKPPEWFGNRSV